MKAIQETGRDFTNYYVNQAGNGMPVFSGTAMQRGHGLGSILKGLFRIATPLLKTAGKQVLRKSAPIIKEAGKQVLKRGLQEMTSSKQPKIMRVTGEVLQNAVTKPKQPKKRVQRRRQPKRVVSHDIFD